MLPRAVVYSQHAVCCRRFFHCHRRVSGTVETSGAWIQHVLLIDWVTIRSGCNGIVRISRRCFISSNRGGRRASALDHGSFISLRRRKTGGRRVPLARARSKLREAGWALRSRGGGRTSWYRSSLPYSGFPSGRRRSARGAHSSSRGRCFEPGAAPRSLTLSKPGGKGCLYALARALRRRPREVSAQKNSLHATAFVYNGSVHVIARARARLRAYHHTPHIIGPLLVGAQRAEAAIGH